MIDDGAYSTMSVVLMFTLSVLFAWAMVHNYGELRREEDEAVAAARRAGVAIPISRRRSARPGGWRRIVADVLRGRICRPRNQDATRPSPRGPQEVDGGMPVAVLTTEMREWAHDVASARGGDEGFLEYVELMADSIDEAHRRELREALGEWETFDDDREKGNRNG